MRLANLWWMVHHSFVWKGLVKLYSEKLVNVLICLFFESLHTGKKCGAEMKKKFVHLPKWLLPRLNCSTEGSSSLFHGEPAANLCCSGFPWRSHYWGVLHRYCHLRPSEIMTVGGYRRLASVIMAAGRYLGWVCWCCLGHRLVRNYPQLIRYCQCQMGRCSGQQASASTWRCSSGCL